MKTEVKKSIGVLNLGILLLIVTIYSTSISGVAFGQNDSIPFEIGDISDSIVNPADNPSNNNNSNSTDYGQNDEIINCDMPPCPPGQVCIQSCPEVNIQ